MVAWFGSKKRVRATAEVLDDGRAAANAELASPVYRGDTHDRHFDSHVRVRVRVRATDRPPFEGEMKAGIGPAALLLPGVVVNVEFDEKDGGGIELLDDLPSILAANPQLKREG